MKNKNAIIAAITAAILAASPLAQAGTFTPEVSSDGFTLGYYQAEINTAEREETERLYAARPMMNVSALNRFLMSRFRAPSERRTPISLTRSTTET